jgi:hypothetical protein
MIEVHLKQEAFGQLSYAAAPAVVVPSFVVVSWSYGDRCKDDRALLRLLLNRKLH